MYVLRISFCHIFLAFSRQHLTNSSIFLPFSCRMLPIGILFLTKCGLAVCKPMFYIIFRQIYEVSSSRDAPGPDVWTLEPIMELDQ